MYFRVRKFPNYDNIVVMLSKYICFSNYYRTKTTRAGRIFPDYK